MRLPNFILLPLAGIANLVTDISGNETPIKGALLDIEAATQVVQGAFNSEQILTIADAGNKLTDSINKAITVVDASPDLGLVATLTLIKPLESLVDTVEDAAETIASKATWATTNGFKDLIRQVLEGQRQSSRTLGTKLVAKTPAIARGTGEAYNQDLDEAYEKMIQAYT